MCSDLECFWSIGTLVVIFINQALPQGALYEVSGTNVKGRIFAVQKALPLMGRGGSIILSGSSVGTTRARAFIVSVWQCGLKLSA